MKSSENKYEALFDKLYEEYSRLVMEIAFAITNDIQLAEDAAQTAFFSIAKNIHKIPDNSEKTRKYIVKTARNSAIDIYRKNRKTRKFEIIIYEETETNDGDNKNVNLKKELSVESFEDMLFKEYDKIKLVESLEKLGEKYSIYLKEYYYDELSMREIAQKHGISEDAAKKRVHRSLERLRNIFLRKGV